MNCPHDLTCLSAYLDGELSPQERVEVEARLERCTACRLVLAELEADQHELVRIQAPQPEGAAWQAFDRRLAAALGAAPVAAGVAGPPAATVRAPLRPRGSTLGLLARVAPIAAAASLLAAFVAQDAPPPEPVPPPARASAGAHAPPAKPLARSRPPLINGADDSIGVFAFEGYCSEDLFSNDRLDAAAAIVHGWDGDLNRLPGIDASSVAHFRSVLVLRDRVAAAPREPVEAVMASSEAAVTRLLNLPPNPQEVAVYGRCLAGSGLRDRVVATAATAAADPARRETLKKIEVLLTRLENLDERTDPDEVRALQETVRSEGFLDQVRTVRTTFTSANVSFMADERPSVR